MVSLPEAPIESEPHYRYYNRVDGKTASSTSTPGFAASMIQNAKGMWPTQERGDVTCSGDQNEQVER